MFLVNSRLGLFTAAPSSLGGRPFSRSYGAILPSSLTTNHSSALGYSPRLPVSVCGTGCIILCLEVFLGSMLGTIITALRRVWCTIVFQLTGGFANRINAYALQPCIPSQGRSYATSSPHRRLYRYGNINPFAIGFAFRLHLRTRLTLI